MSGDGVDPLRALRERLVELVGWLAEDAARLPTAQDARRHPDELRARRERAEVDRLLLAAAGERPLAFAPLGAASAPADVVSELEAVDRAAWLAAGAAREAPPQVLRRGGLARYVVRLSRPRRPRGARQAGALATHLRHHALVPPVIDCGDNLRSYRVRVKYMAHGTARCEAARARGEIAVATTSFDDAAAIDWRALTVATARARVARLRLAIGRAARAGVDILVAPELTIPAPERAALVERLRWARGSEQLALLVPGSFHERAGRGDAARVYNRAVLLDGKGNALLGHRKLTRYGLLDGWLEEIAVGDEVTVLVTPIGTVAVAICKDFCDDVVGRVWQQLQPEWLLVPAYGSGASAHEKAAQQIARVVGTVTILAHEGDRSLDAAPNSFVHDAHLERRSARAPAFSQHNVPYSNDLYNH